MAKAFDLTITAWSPLGMGVLTGKYSGGVPKTHVFLGVWKKLDALYHRAQFKIAEVVLDIAKK